MLLKCCSNLNSIEENANSGLNTIEKKTKTINLKC